MKQKRYGILDNISSPADLRGLSYDTLGVLCAALREFIVDSVSQTGGHLASNLGIVELAVALEREFDSSRDRIIYDVGHQCYVHKILTGRRDRFDTLRQYGGLCGFMKPEESITDPCITATPRIRFRWRSAWRTPARSRTRSTTLSRSLATVH